MNVSKLCFPSPRFVKPHGPIPAPSRLSDNLGAEHWRHSGPEPDWEAERWNRSSSTFEERRESPMKRNLSAPARLCRRRRGAGRPPSGPATA